MVRSHRGQEAGISTLAVVHDLLRDVCEEKPITFKEFTSA